MCTTPLVCPKNCDGGGGGRGHRNLTHKTSLHGDFAVGKLLPQRFLGAPCACECAGAKNFTKKIVKQKSRVDATLALEFVGVDIKHLKLDTIPE